MMTDEELMLAYARGDEAALRELFRRYAPMLLRVLARHVGRCADAQDLLQHPFLRLPRARRACRGNCLLRPWIMTIAMNLARDLLRRRGRRPEVAVEEATLPPALTVQPAVDGDDDVRKRVRA